MAYSPSESDWIWLAGVFDGEGHISVVQRAPRPNGTCPVAKRLAITNTDPRLLLRIARRFGGKIHVHCSNKYRQSFQWYTYDRMRYILAGMLPHLIVKRDEARLALAFLDAVERDPKDRRFLTPAAREARQKLFDRFQALRSRLWTAAAIPAKYRTGRIVYEEERA